MDQKLSKLVEGLTTSGEPQLNPEKMKELKKICKSSEEQLSHAYHLLTAQLSQDHAEIRLSAFQAIDELFARSHQFRMLVVSNFQEFLELTLGTDHEQPLPPPREVAQRLRQAATRAVQGWHDKYGAAYKKLALGYHFLRHSKQVDFQDLSARTLAERKRQEEKQERLDRIRRERSERAIREMEEMSEEIRRCLTEVESCFRLLVPLDFATGLGASLPWAGLDVSEQSALCQASAMNRGDEEQPCCSKTLLACTRHPGAGGREGPPPAATGADEQEEEEDSDSDDEGFVRRHGLGSHKYTLDVELSSDSLRVREDEDNRAVIHSARDALKLIQYKFLPAVCSWVQLFTRAEIHGGHLEAAIHLKAELETALRRSGELDIKPEDGRRREVAAPGDRDEDEDDGDFVEVPEKEGYEACIPDHLRPEYGGGCLARRGVCSRDLPSTHRGGLEKDPAARGLQAGKTTRRGEEAHDPTSAAAQLHQLHGRLPPPPSPRAPVGPEAGKLAAERARAPVVPFGVDLCYWGQEQPMAGKILKCDSEHRFWKPSEVDTEVDSAAVSEMLQSRYITFAGKFEPVQHRCHAPRPDGRLCERQDRLKCPFHGKIIPRDDTGRPLHPEDRAWEQRQQLQRQAGRADWQDPEFMRDVEAATGVDLGSSRSSGRGKGKRRKHPGLTDLKQQANTARARIAKKVFAKAAVQRVVTAMNQMDQKKHEKFANQFNYALN
ncbi:UV-stimulated scaffold protein A isoform X2 [Ailuropoda melanoleuca]|nr:UV-stimulated scaffold protein A isoform X2 [Ailuropoda melanoleuca]XP_019660628.1 UV-stimulated scaffold protein A isoform X2 [Ailuropoda melanoleuca]XP_034528129.1 UV-stimulated scaffold protein A isoform X2 [Ailuropoda melanoleuca]XP_034528130.1 UV-stimulated scaffold protein A isoform X2 [Ailuropoda melanoleuca]